ncbi:MAG: hypothetical protein FWE39_16885 [Nocardiaceae bacterium]|nr:hypothetical protein [Nocardiaceae bacterium]
MRISNFSNRTRRRMVVTAAALGAAGAIAVPGVAWAQNSIPGGSPVAVGTPAAEVTPAAELAPVVETAPGGENCDASVKPLTDEELQKLIDEGVVTMATESVPATAVEDVATDVAVPEGEAGEAEAPVAVSAVTITTRAC